MCLFSFNVENYSSQDKNIYNLNNINGKKDEQ